MPPLNACNPHAPETHAQPHPARFTATRFPRVPCSHPRSQSWGCFYGTASSVYGPYTYVGSVIDTAALTPAFRTNHTDGPWYSHEDYADRHGSFWHNAGGQWFYASNDRSHSTDVGHESVFRDTVVGYVHYFANGSIAPVPIDATGVGEYAAAHIEAENFMRLSGGARKLHVPARGDAFVVEVHDASTAELAYPHVAGMGAAAALELVAANGGSAAVTVTARRGTAAGAVLATCVVAPTGGAYARTACALDTAAVGSDALDVDVVLTFSAPRGALLQLDAIAFV